MDKRIAAAERHQTKASEKEKRSLDALRDADDNGRGIGRLNRPRRDLDRQGREFGGFRAFGTRADMVKDSLLGV